MATKPYPGNNIPTAKPSRRTIDLRSLSYGLSGPEQPYPVYQFAGGNARFEFPGHNPFRPAQGTGTGPPAGKPQLPTPVISLATGTYTGAQTVTLSLSQTGIPIYYTLDGSTPTAASPVYTGPINVATTTTISAIAIASAYTPSAVAVSMITISGQVQPPTASPAPGTYVQLAALSVTLADTTPGSTIYYTTDGSTPTTGSTVYSGPISVSGNETIKTLVTALGYTPSAISSFSYTIMSPTVAMPTASPVSGGYAGQITVSLTTTTPSAQIYYTLDGSTPTNASLLYSGPFTIPSAIVPSVTVNAIGSLSGYLTSGVASFTYTFNSQAAEPVFSPPAGTYSASSVSVTITDATPTSAIYYSLNGGAQQLYTGPISVASNTTITATATAIGYATSSPASAAYVIGSVKASILSFLNSIAGKFILSAQTAQIPIGNNGTVAQANAVAITPLQSLTGHLPAMIGVIADCMEGNLTGSYPLTTAKTLINNQNAVGGLSHVSLYLGNPVYPTQATYDGGGHVLAPITQTQWHQMATPGNVIYDQWQKQLGIYIVVLQSLASPANPILLRPFIEWNGAYNWFGGITGGTSSADAQKIWQNMHDTIEAGMAVTGQQNSLIWVYNVNQNVGGYMDRYPGNAYVDVVSLDVYADHDTVHDGGNGLADYALAGNAYSSLVATGKPFMYSEIGFHEATGCTIDEVSDLWYLQLIQQYTPKAFAALVFCDYGAVGNGYPSNGNGYNSLPTQRDASAFMNNAAVINLGGIHLTGGGGGTVTATPTLIQVQDNEGPNPPNTPLSSVTTLFASNVTPSNTIIGLHTIATYAGQHPALQFSDSAGDQVPILQQILNPSANQMGANPTTNYSQQMEMFDVLNAIGGQTSVTVQTPTSDQDYQAMFLTEWADVDHIAGFAANNQAGVVVGQPWVGIPNGAALTSGNITVAATDLPAVIVGFCMNQSALGTGVISPAIADSGVTGFENVWGFNTGKLTATFTYRTINTPGTYSANFTARSSTNESYMTMAVVLAGTTAGGGGTTTPPGKAQNLVMSLQGQHAANTSVYDNTTGFWDAPFPNSTSISWTSATPGTNPIVGNNVWRSTNGAAPVQLNTGGLNATTSWTDDTATLSVNSTAGSTPPYYVANTYQYFVEEIDSTGVSSGLTAQQSYYWYKNGVKHGIGGDFSGASGGSVTVNYNDTTYDSNGAITFTWTGSNGYFLPWAGNEVVNYNFWAGAYGYLSFDYRAITETNMPQFAIDRAGDIPIYNRLNGTNGAGGTTFSLAPYMPTPVVGQWVTCKIPLASLLLDYGPPSAPYATPVIQYSMYKFLIQSTSGNAGKFGIRNIVFTAT